MYVLSNFQVIVREVVVSEFVNTSKGAYSVDNIWKTVLFELIDSIQTTEAFFFF